MKNLRIADLELFITAAHLKNLGQAATLHHLSQSAASSAVQRVEKAFGYPLCTHEKRQFRLTHEGERVLPRAESWLKALSETLIKPEALPIRIVTTHAIARVAVPPLLPVDSIELQLMRPDRAYAAILRGEADVALVLDNALWEGVIAKEVSKGSFQLYSRKKTKMGPVLLPEDQIEVLTLQQRFLQEHGTPLSIKARVPSWSLIADICKNSDEIGFLPDFLGREHRLTPVKGQPTPSHYRLLALYKLSGEIFEKRFDELLKKWHSVFI